jgi:phosphocarrier protein NPr
MIVEKQLTIVNKLGLHARAATQLAKLANQFEATITMHQEDKEAFANISKSFLILLMHCYRGFKLIS